MRGDFMIAFREIEFGSEDYRRECDLRNEVLYASIGLPARSFDPDSEKRNLHYGLFDDGETLIACVMAVPASGAEARIRQMAVRSPLQGRGMGRMLLECAEKNLAGRGFTQLHLHARMTAVGFYEKLGYAKCGGEFTEVGLPHIRMEKRLDR